jgi:hypothetical protein
MEMQSSNPSDMFKSIQTRRVTEQVCPHEEKEVFDRIFKEVEELGVLFLITLNMMSGMPLIFQLHV